MEEAMERRICSAFIKHLNDTSLEVKANAVKSITIVVPIIREQNVVMIIETLTNMVIDASAKDVRDIYSLTIRTSLVELKDQAAINMIRAVYPKLKNGLKSNKEEVQEECIEILSEIFRNFGQILFKNNNLVNKDEVMKILLDILSQSSKNLRKKATVCLGQFGIILNVRQLL
jgi:translation initiation factor 2 alpha subunit (eIF-2alpha)|tara:strand:+ start:295 stop:813 length:519 start_codon:yes stop_codon:yes gene_type:complete